MRHAYTLAALLTSAALLSCSKEPLETPVQEPVNDSRIITLTATLAPKSDGAATKALTENGNGTITASWCVDDEIWVGYTNNSGSTVENAKAIVTDVDTDGRATITMNLVDPKDNTEITLGYPYSYYMSDNLPEQDGKLSTIAQHYDTAYGTGLLKVNGGTAELEDNVAMRNRTLIWKFNTFTEGTVAFGFVHKIMLFLQESDGDFYTLADVAVYNTSAPYYIAVPALAGDMKDATIYIAIEDDSTTGSRYFKGKSGVTLQAGKMYATPSLALKQVSIYDAPAFEFLYPYRGWVIANDGKMYKHKNSIPGEGQCVGMVAYWGAPGTADSSSETYSGLAIAPDYFPSTKYTGIAWSSDATHTCLTPCTTHGKGRADMSGISNTAALLSAEHLADGHAHPTAQAVAGYSVPTPPGASGWFLPTYGQWLKALTSYCGQGDSLGETGEGGNQTTFNSFINDLTAASSGISSSASSNFFFWTSTEYDAGNAFLVQSAQQKTIRFVFASKTSGGDFLSERNVRPFFAF